MSFFSRCFCIFVEFQGKADPVFECLSGFHSRFIDHHIPFHRSFVEIHRAATFHFDALIVYHSAALGVFAAGLPPHKPSVRLAKAIAAVSPYQYPPVNTGCTYTGNLSDWSALQGIAAVDLELMNHLNTDFTINLKVMEILLKFK